MWSTHRTARVLMQNLERKPKSHGTESLHAAQEVFFVIGAELILLCLH